MKTHDVFRKLPLMIIAVMMAGCGKQDVVLDIDTSSKNEITSAINELPDRLYSCRSRETDWFVYSNICCAVRQVADADARKSYSLDYTGKVMSMAPKPPCIRNDDSVKKWRIAMENYVCLVRWGGVLLSENLPMNVDMWDFLLAPIILIRMEISSHKQWLISRKLDSWHVEKDYHVRMLGDLLTSCQREVNDFWYPEAKRKLDPGQLQQVRQKVLDVFGVLPPEMVEDE